MRKKLMHIAALAASLLLPAPLLRTGAHDWIDPDAAEGPRLARSAASKLRADIGAADFGTGSAHFDGEWWLATYAFAAVGYANVARTHPETRAEMAEAARFAAAQLVRPEVRSFDTRVWGDDMLDCLHRNDHDHAVLGYIALGLGAARELDPELPQSDLHDDIIATLTRRLDRPGALLATYPGQGFPVDVAMTYAAIGHHARLTRHAPPPVLLRRLDKFEHDFVTEDGLLVQMVEPHGGRALDHARGSGTALAAWALGDVDPALSARLARGTRDVLGESVMGLGVVSEYRATVSARGDIDSGPLVLGWSVSATGFAIGAGRRLGDRAWTGRLWATARLFGIPTGRSGFLTGGHLGNALMLAFLTTPEPS